MSNSLASALQSFQQNQLDDAYDEITRSVEKEQNHNPNAWMLKGQICHRLKRFKEAAESHIKASALDPNNLVHYNNAGFALLANKNAQDAKKIAQKAYRLAPSAAQICLLLGMAEFELEEYHDAKRHLIEAKNLSPNHPLILFNLAKTLSKLAEFPDALAAFEKALAIAPNDENFHLHHIQTAESFGNTDYTRQCYQNYLARFPNDGMRIREALLIPHIFPSTAALETARAQLEHKLAALHNTPLSLNHPEKQLARLPFYHAYHGKNDRHLLESFGQLIRKSAPSLISKDLPIEWSIHHTKHPEFPIRIGFVSNYVHNSIVADCFNQPIIELAKCYPEFEIHVFTNSTHTDEYTAHLEQHIHTLHRLKDTPEYAREIITQTACDILIYQDVGMDPFSYFLAFSRLAPIQCNTTGHPITSGLDTLDYYISSSLIEPENAQEHYTETLIQLDHIPGRGPVPFVPKELKSKKELGLPEHGNLYICPVSPHKIHPDLYPVLKAILEQDSSAHFLLSQYYEPNAWIPELQSALKHNLGEPLYNRIIFLPWASHETFSHILLNCDVALDPFHFSMGSTAYLVLGLGLPLITWPGEFMRGRGGYGLYKRMHIFDCVASSHEEYVSLALKTAKDKHFHKNVSDRIKAQNYILQDFLPAVHDLAHALKQILPTQPPLNHQILNNLATEEAQKNHWVTALRLYQEGLALAPNDPILWLNLAATAETYGDYPLTKQTLEECFKHTHNNSIALRLALLTPHIFESRKALEQARTTLEESVETLLKQPLSIELSEETIADLRPFFFHAYHGKNDRQLLEKIAAFFRRACPELSPTHTCDVTRKEEKRRDYRNNKKRMKGLGNIVTDAHTQGENNNASEPHSHEQKRIGIISSCFTNGIVSTCFYEPIKELIAQYPEFDVVLFSPTPIDPTTPEPLQQRHIVLPRNLQSAQEIIRSEYCDILLYTDIGMDTFLSFLAFARLAPIQCNTTGHPITSGLESIDYYISSTLIEPENAQEHYTETLILLDHIPGKGPAPFIPKTIKSKKELGLPEQGNLYICPVSPHKIHPDLHNVFAKILEQDPSAYLILFEYHEPNAWTAQLQSALQKNLSKNLLSRILFLPWANQEKFSHILLNCDVALDPFHFSMGSTAYLVLGLGLPLITWPGEFMRGRGGYGLYKRMQIFDCVAHSHEEYISLALKTANDKNFRDEIILKIRKENHLLQDFLPAVHDLAHTLHTLTPR